MNLNDTNLLNYYIFKEFITIDEGNECEFPTDAIKENWQVTNGSLQIETKVTGANIIHNLKLIQAQFKNDETTFSVTDRNLGAYSLQ